MSKGLIHHIELYVSDLKRSVEFWGWLLEELGYEVFQSWEKGQSWKLDETYIVFVQAEEKYLDIPYHRCRVGLNHLAFHASSRQHVDEITQALMSKGVKILYTDKHPFAGGDQYYAVFFEDPDRIKVELVAP
ncbi:VOC family protein [Falsibacillus pallidus]|uniref:Catechol 2,3-dioxygenase-like lactoylglutathione lyase family enzyme n=1 Tax=Falsibacillus pallidus TaxID=493781 RepID=A0A370G045_9BACI|nr:VOC family protein [Falsibacillus pallidus]RDI37261.1 catechol 2,3-dioxygenase-like lactoylglutathione lyase family enzyme [Falsibacillus pallidus]